MNSVKLQDIRPIYRNLIFSLYTDNEPLERGSKNKKILFKIAPKKNKIPRNKFNQGGERPIV